MGSKMIFTYRVTKELRYFFLFSNSFTASSESDVASPDHHPSKHLTVDSTSLHSPVSIWSRDSVFIRGNSTEEETSIAESTGLKPVDESSSSATESKDERSEINESEENASERTVSESQSTDSNVKRVNRLSSIEDLSHIYENFLAFASAMAEKSPKFQEQLYHVYENVTQAFDSRSQGTTMKEGEVAEKRASTAQETTVQNELGSPSMEMNSEFEKISLREKEDRYSTYRYSGICGESELEKLDEVFIEREHSCIQNTLAEDENENNPEDGLLSSTFSGESSRALATDSSTLEGELSEASSGSKEDVLNNIVAGVNKTETGTSCEKYHEIEEVEVVENDGEVSGDSSLGNESQATDVVESSSQTSPQDEDARENQVEVSTAVQVAPFLVHAEHVSAVETEGSSFYLVQEVNDQVWGEIESDEMREPVIETNLQMSTTAESVNDRDSSASVVFALGADEDDDEGIAADVEVQEPILEGIHVDARDDSNIPSDDDGVGKQDVSCVDQPCFAVVQEASLLNTDDAVRVGSDCQEQSGLCAAESSETSVPPTSISLGHVEAHCEQTVLSAVSESEHSQESEGQDLKMCNTTELTGRDKPVLTDVSRQRDSNSETEVLESYPEGSRSEFSQDEENPVDSSLSVDVEADENINSCSLHNTFVETESLEAHLSPEGDAEEAAKTPEHGTTKYSSDEEYLTPEGTLDLSEGNSNDTDRDLTEPNSPESTPENNHGLNCERSEASTGEAVQIVQSESGDETAPTLEECDDSRQKECVTATEPASDSDNTNLQSDSFNTWSDSSNLEELTRSQMDILKAVTAAFEEILELHGDESDTDDTKL